MTPRRSSLPLWLGSALVLLVLTAGPAQADNCSNYSDCYGAGEAANDAVFGLILLGASLLIDLSPLGRVRGVIEAGLGKDILTGQQLSTAERLIGLVPGGRSARAMDGLSGARRGSGGKTPPRAPQQVPPTRAAAPQHSTPRLGDTAEADGADAVRGLSQTERATLDDALRPEKLDHIFDPKHNFDPLVQQFGSREAVLEHIVRSIGGPLPQAGRFEIAQSVGGQTVVIRGAVVDGVPRIGTAFTP